MNTVEAKNSLMLLMQILVLRKQVKIHAISSAKKNHEFDGTQNGGKSGKKIPVRNVTPKSLYERVT